jgi:hypothetical protein
MLPIQKAIQDIEFKIPNEILELAFLRKINMTNVIRPTLEQQIESLVIKPKVLADTSLIGGTTITVPVDKCYQEVVAYNPTANYLVIYVPPELRDNRNIVSALSLNYSTFGTDVLPFGLYTNGALKMANMAMDSVDTNTGGFATTNLELIGPNTILVHENIYSAIGGFLRIKVEYQEDMRDLNPRAYPYFSKLCLLAIQAYIYTKLAIEIDKGYVYGGHEINKVSEIIESYSDKWEEYDEYLQNTWRKIAFMNDTESNSRFIKAMINPIL